MEKLYKKIALASFSVALASTGVLAGPHDRFENDQATASLARHSQLNLEDSFVSATAAKKPMLINSVVLNKKETTAPRSKLSILVEKVSSPFKSMLVTVYNWFGRLVFSN